MAKKYDSPTDKQLNYAKSLIFIGLVQPFIAGFFVTGRGGPVWTWARRFLLLAFAIFFLTEGHVLLSALVVLVLIWNR